MTGIHQALGSTGGRNSGGTKKLIDLILSNGLFANLDCCFDAGDIDSYSGSGQIWSDVSGNGYGLYRGTTSGTEASDPVFVGSPGSLGETNYWTGDGVTNMGFTWVGSAPTFQNPWPKSGGLSTIVFIFFNSSGGDFFPWDSSNPVGISIQNRGAGTTNRISVSITDTPTASSYTTTATINTTTVNFSAFATAAAASSTAQINSTQESWTPGATTVAGNSTAPIIIPNNSNGFAAVAGTGKRLFAVAAWSRQLSTTELNTLYTACKTRFTSIP